MTTDRKEYTKQRYHRLKEEKRCTNCGKQDERTLSGKTMCQSCERNEKTYREKYADKRAFLYNERKRQGLCTRCGKKNDRKNKISCTECAQLYKKWKFSYVIKQIEKEM